ncbi:hypothetical protein B0H63DRAFT_221540 [Podospora didyma]|uniref:Amine oxidase domain-containing protein n=1 Tax=Podospora didyma TaxID=330526 RepID=A0AAE0NBS6_9PEZI|nr:hypothetical protein B0H63DRAFT_221540 [Podospora didyma]
MFRTLLTVVVLPWATAEAAGPVNIIHKDVAIIGGGGSGAYSAVRLREDFGVSVVVIEKDGILGGHVNTWVDPATGRGFDAGVQNYLDLPGAKEFFTRFGVATQPNVRNVLDQYYIDFTTGARLTNYSPPPTSDRTAALRRYLQLAEQYLSIMEPGWWTFPPPKDIPADLLLPFRDFVAKYNLTAGVPQIFFTTGFGVHDLMGSLTMWVMRSFNVDLARTILGINTAFVPSSRKNQDLYDAILRLLGDDVLLNSTVVSSERPSANATTNGPVILTVRSSSTGATTLIVAKKLLFTAPPTPNNLAPFDPDPAELSTFSRFRYSATYVGIVTHPSLPRNASLLNTPLAAQPANWLASIPAAPFIARFESYPDSPYYRAIAVGDETLNSAEARKLIEGAFANVLVATTGKTAEEEAPLEFMLFEPHGLVSAYASREDLVRCQGLIQRLNKLQGRRGMWFTGAAWSVHISTSLWVFTDTLLPRVVASLGE